MGLPDEGRNREGTQMHSEEHSEEHSESHISACNQGGSRDAMREAVGCNEGGSSACNEGGSRDAIMAEGHQHALREAVGMQSWPDEGCNHGYLGHPTIEALEHLMRGAIRQAISGNQWQMRATIEAHQVLEHPPRHVPNRDESK